ncbi:PRC-barrel domain containing protein [Roseomonas frigidaquae]|uniref:PRC-barrel domain containing protein n=1 Tax=Falsiroseomonas frigidaquae TaxID=487318 RepID=A0ABX1F1E5_9PROT|nr:PRC-barrel domain-containing protein [Falsiroseomonas frigidaquae]NKE46166.1 PRC-barrel domain containing protein [Falsiroseomonas frigidaquae]
MAKNHISPPHVAARSRPNLLATTATAAALALAFASGANSQVTSDPPRVAPAEQNAQPDARQDEALPRALPRSMPEAEQELRVAHQQMAAAQNDISPQALRRARLALEGVSRSIDQSQPGRLTQGATNALQQRVDQARRVLASETPDALQARLAIDEVLAALPPVVATMRQGEPGTPATGASAAPAPAQSGGMGQQAAARTAGGVELSRASNLVGTNVVASTGRDAGEIENLLIDSGGQVRAAVVEWGGFLGIGARRSVVPVEQLTFGAPDERVRMDLTRDQLERLPRYDPDRLEEYGRMDGWGALRTYR